MGNDEGKLKRIHWILITVSMLFVVGLLLYVWVNVKYPASKTKQIMTYFVGIVVILAIVAGFVMFIISLIKKDDDEVGELAKDYVGTHRALEIWKETAMEHLGISYVHQTWLDETKLQPAVEDAIRIRNETSFTDPKKETSDTFLAFEAFVRAGKRLRSMVVVIRTDEGERWIRENWNWRIRDSQTINVYDPELDRYPLTSSKDITARLMAKRIDMKEEGYTEEELQQSVDPYLRQQQLEQGRNEKPYQKPEGIRSPEVSPQFYQESSDVDENDRRDIEDDQEEWRKGRRSS